MLYVQGVYHQHLITYPRHHTVAYSPNPRRLSSSSLTTLIIFLTARPHSSTQHYLVVHATSAQHRHLRQLYSQSDTRYHRLSLCWARSSSTPVLVTIVIACPESVHSAEEGISMRMAGME
jgi:hypothetical protein